MLPKCCICVSRTTSGSTRESFMYKMTGARSFGLNMSVNVVFVGLAYRTVYTTN